VSGTSLRVCTSKAYYYALDQLKLKPSSAINTIGGNEIIINTIKFCTKLLLHYTSIEKSACLGSRIKIRGAWESEGSD
jgi:hypothetical protein